MSEVLGFNAAGIGAGMGGLVGISPADRAAERELAAAVAASRHEIEHAGESLSDADVAALLAGLAGGTYTGRVQAAGPAGIAWLNMAGDDWVNPTREQVASLRSRHEWAEIEVAIRRLDGIVGRWGATPYGTALGLEG